IRRIPDATQDRQGGGARRHLRPHPEAAHERSSGMTTTAVLTTTQHTTTEAAENARALILQAFRPQGNTVIEVGGQQLALVVEKVIGNSLIGWLWDDDE